VVVVVVLVVVVLALLVDYGRCMIIISIIIMKSSFNRDNNYCHYVFKE
jgi:uncharacterized membrane protein